MVSWRLERVAALLAGFKLLLQLAAIAPYGYCRDELYYLACSEHLALGYVDHPPLSIVVLRIWRAAFGNSVTSIRVVPALAGASLVYITVRTARALGARTPAAALAGLGVVTAPAFFGFDHYFSMNALDHVVWAVAVRLVLDLDGSDRYRRIFLLLGAVLGLGALNKWSVGWLAPGLVLGVLVTPARGALLYASRSRRSRRLLLR